MQDFLPDIGTALWLGILTSISPCPLATNIAAISYIGRQVGSPKHTLLAGLLYTIGRTLAYTVLGWLLVGSLLELSGTSMALQYYMERLLGPLLIIIGMLLLELLSFNMTTPALADKMQSKVDRWGIWGSLPLGIVFALSFCPTSAALFFGSLITIALRCNSPVAAPLAYGIGTALPVVLFSAAVASGAQAVGKAYGKVKQFEWWSRRITGAVFILIGIYYTLRYVFGLF